MTLRRAALLVLAIALPACAEAVPPAEAPPAPAPAPSAAAFDPTVKSALGEADNEMMAIARAEDEIDHLLPGRSSGKKKGEMEPLKPADKPGVQGKAGAPSPRDPAGPAADQPQGLSTSDSCATACKALGSMTTSADHLCKLTGEMDGRCEDARGRVRAATTRVRVACPACSAGMK